MSNNLKCIVCGEEYSTCGCSKDLNSYKVITESTNHFKIYHVVNDFYNKVIDKGEALTRLKKCNIEGYEKFNKTYVDAIKKILTPDINDQSLQVEDENTQQVKKVKSKKRS